MREEEKARERKLLERYEESINMIRTDQEDTLSKPYTTCNIDTQ